MACNEVIYKGKKYSEEEFFEMGKSGELDIRQSYGKLAPEHNYYADEKLSISDMMSAYKAEKKRLQDIGADILIDNGKHLRYILPEDKQPDVFYSANENNVKSSPKILGVLSSDKIRQLYNKFYKTNPDKFYQELIPLAGKQQVDLLKDYNRQYNPQSLDEMLAGIAAQLSYTVEINTAKGLSYREGLAGINNGYDYGTRYPNFEYEGYYFSSATELDNDGEHKMMYRRDKQRITRQEFIDAAESFNKITEQPTQHYSNLTVPGGTNYTENEIATPGIVPSIKGHAQFSTDNGLGWFRSDEKASKGGNQVEDLEDPAWSGTRKFATIDKNAVGSKTRRILEVQSDLFQKGRDKSDLVAKPTIPEYVTDVEIGKLYDRAEIEGWTQEKLTEEQNKVYQREKDSITTNPQQNQFLQLLNKDNNWVRFFIQSIVQDSAKKGYEKVLFPTGDTASKVEGHQTLEDFKKQKEDRIEELEKEIKKPEEQRLDSHESEHYFNPRSIGSKFEYARLQRNEKDSSYVPDEVKGYRGWYIFEYSVGKGNNITRLSDKEAQEILDKNSEFNYQENKDRNTQEIKQLQEELKRVETEGFAALKPIYNFYENTVGNILKKIYGKDGVVRIKDEYGNEWYEVGIEQKRDSSHIYFQGKDDTGTTISSKASKETVEKWNQWFKDNGVDYESVTGGLTDEQGNPIDASEKVDVVNKVVRVAEGHQETTIPEAGMHIIARIIKQKNATLWKEMMKGIGNFEMLSKVIERYKGFKTYQLPDGKPDIAKMKEEAIGKILAEYHILSEEGFTEKPQQLNQVRTWWQKIIDYLKDFFKGNPSGTAAKEREDNNSQVFKDVAKSALSISSDRVGISEADEFYSASEDKGKEVFDKWKTIADNIEHVKEGDQNYYNLKSEGRKIANRVTDKVKKAIDKNFSQQERKSEWDTKADTGTKGHADIDDILERYIDKESGIKRNSPLVKVNPSQINPKEEGYYAQLENMLSDIISPYPTGTRFVWETPIYDPDGDIVGSPDLVAILPNGETDTYDWKFLDLNQYMDDIPKYKKKLFNIQMNEYAKMQSKLLGAQVRKSRIIPIQAEYKKTGDIYEFAGIKVGDSSNGYKGETRKYMLPFPSSAERHDDKRVQQYIDSLNAIIDRMESESRNQVGNKKIHTLQDIEHITGAIRDLQVKDDVSLSANIAMTRLDQIGSKLVAYSNAFKDDTYKDYSEEDLRRIAGELNNARDFISTFDGLEHLFQQPEVKDTLVRLTSRVKKAQEYIGELDTELIEKGFANPRNLYGVAGIDEVSGQPYADKITKWHQELWNTTSSANTRAGQLFHKIQSETNNKYILKSVETEEHHEEVKVPVREWIASHSAKEFQDLLLEKDNKKWKLISKYSKEFYSKLKDELKNKDISWISEKDSSGNYKNVDLVKYREDYERELENYKNWATDYANLHVEEGDNREERVKKFANTMIEQFQKKYDVDAYPATAISLANDKLWKFPTEEWQSADYKKLAQHKAVLDYYNYIQDRFRKAKNLGILGSNWRTFFPQIAKSFVESLSGEDKLKNAIRSIGSTISVKPGDGGHIDPLTQAEQNTLSANFIHDIGAVDSKGNKTYTNISRNIFSVMDLFNAEIDRMETYQPVEEVVKLLLNVEKEKLSYKTTYTGDIVKRNGKIELKQDDTNYKILENMINTAFYNKNMSFSESGLGWNWDYNSFARKWNERLGTDALPLSSHESVYVSLPKIVRTGNKMIALKALGFNPITPIANLFGGRMQAWIDARLVERSDFDQMKALVARSNFTTGKEQVAGALLKFFSPFTHDEILEKARKDDLNKWNHWLSTAIPMGWLKKSEEHVQATNALAYMKNLMVSNGKLVNIGEYVKEKYDYKNLYNRPYAETKSIEKKIKDEITDLKKSSSILSIAKIINNKLEIPGLKDKSDYSVLDAREKMIQMNRDATGSLSSYEKMKVDNNFIGASVMLFHHWIPPLVTTRFSNLGYHAGSSTYRWGRWKMLGAAIHEKGLGAVSQLVSHLTGGEEATIELAKTLYEKKRQMMAEKGELQQFDANMNKAQFIDMFKDGMRANLIDAASALTLLAAYLTVSALQKENEDEELSGMYKALARVSDKLSDELLFFYSPASFQQMTGSFHSSLLPMLSIATDAEKFIKSSAKELYYDRTGDEDLEEKNKVLKYPISYTPGLNKMVEWYGMFDDDFAKYFKGEKIK